MGVAVRMAVLEALAESGAERGARLMWMFLLWWCVDDHLAAALDTPGLGKLPIWVPLIIGHRVLHHRQRRGETQPA